jgi:SAM-dependent methyltransferase
MNEPAYDVIGLGYTQARRSDPWIARRITDALRGASSIVNVGAGAGSYEPSDRPVVAVEPSTVMIRQRPPGAAPVVRAVAEAMPFADDSFDAVLAVLAIHHFSDRVVGLREMARVARERVVILAWDPDKWAEFWLVRDYFPAIAHLDRDRTMSPGAMTKVLGNADVQPVPIPADCVDGFTGAFWRRPHAYLDPRVRGAMSTFASIGARARDEGLERLAADLRDGSWRRRNSPILERDELDIGYRLLVFAIR